MILYLEELKDNTYFLLSA